ncbi:MAG: hypothetical protein IJ529_01150 [Alphaproteobacteria bacterium]|nr:hypothetical protein [Alphaproteobacteria bacterium]MBQ9234900.1 hypothetical protein [Alphaproteobacteria bacterium]
MSGGNLGEIAKKRHPEYTTIASGGTKDAAVNYAPQALSDLQEEFGKHLGEGKDREITNRIVAKKLSKNVESVLNQNNGNPIQRVFLGLKSR